MNRSRFALFMQFSAVVAAATIGNADCCAQIWGILPSTNQIVRVNPVTGGVFGGFTPPGGALVSGQLFGGLTIAENGAALLYQNPVANPTSLYRLNPVTSVLLSTETMPAAIGNPDFRAGLSFESGVGGGGNDAIFAVNDGGPIQRQDGYGNAVLVDHSPGGATFAGALGGDDNGRHFVAANGMIREFDPANANVTLNTLPAPAVNDALLGLAYDGNRIYLSSANGQLFTLDGNTGAVLNSVFVQGGALIGLAVRAVPEPSAVLLTMIGFLGLLVERQRRRG